MLTVLSYGALFLTKLYSRALQDLVHHFVNFNMNERKFACPVTGWVNSL
jgi:hypothetical protein